MFLVNLKRNHWVLWLAVLFCELSAAATVNIAVVGDPTSSLDAVSRAQLRSELSSLSDTQLTYQILEDDGFSHRWTAASARQAIERALSDSRTDMVIALDIIASSVAADFRPAKPLIAATVIQPAIQGFSVTDAGSSAIENLHLLTTSLDFAGALAEFQAATGAENVAVLIDASLLSAVPSIAVLIDELQSSVDFALSVLEQDPADLTTLGFVPEGVDALFVTPLQKVSPQDYSQLIRRAEASKLATFSSLGRGDVLAGFLMGRTLVIPPDQLARRLAIDVRDLALGRSTKDLVITLDVRDRLVINRRTAEAIGFQPSFELIFASEILNEDLPTGRVLTLRAAVEEALERNLQRAIAVRDLDVAREDSNVAKGALLPQLTGDLSWLDQDRDLALSGPTTTTQASLTLAQNIYSEQLSSSYRSQRFLERARDADLYATELDVIETAAQTYLGLLIAKTERDIQVENLDLTRANLERANFRYQVGSTSRSEVFRFETELGIDQQSVTQAQAAYEQQQFELNRVLQQPIALPFQVDETGIVTPQIFGDDRFDRFLAGPVGVQTLSDFLAEKALLNAPELASLRAEIDAQDRLLLAAERRRYVPTISAVGEASEIIDDRDALVSTDFDRDWSVGVEATWSLFEGGAIRAAQRRAEFQLDSLELTLQQTSDIIEAQARSALADVVSSRLNIGFANETANAARSTLDLVTDSYVRGTASYIDLIDAQNAFISARLAAANAVFTHLQNLVRLQRSVSFFDFAVSTSEADAWLEQLLDFAQANQGTNR
ncbi:MAG: TolC family protein [Pseudomonadota bacterium]